MGRRNTEGNLFFSCAFFKLMEIKKNLDTCVYKQKTLQNKRLDLPLWDVVDDTDESLIR